LLVWSDDDTAALQARIDDLGESLASLDTLTRPTQ
jgi:hypothetical protein